MAGGKAAAKMFAAKKLLMLGSVNKVRLAIEVCGKLVAQAGSRATARLLRRLTFRSEGCC